MKKVILAIGLLALSGSKAAFAADPYPTCDDALGNGYNLTAYMVGAAYNRAACDRDSASEYETLLMNIIPGYWVGVSTTPAKEACLFKGSYEGWTDGMKAAYAKCATVPGFESIPYRTLGLLAAKLFQSLWTAGSSTAPNYVTVSMVNSVFATDPTLPLSGSSVECESAIRGTISGVGQPIVSALVAAVCGPQ
jgi:hypothetical protein